MKSGTGGVTAADSWPRKGIVALLIGFVAVQTLLTVRTYRFGYDESIYIALARYLSSLGESGFYETTRPVFLSAVLAVFDVVGFDIGVMNKVLAICAAGALIWTTYLATSMVSDRVAGLYAALILAGSGIMFSYAPFFLTGIPSACLGMASFVFFLRRSFFIAGLLAGLSFVSRYPNGILFVGYACVFAWVLLNERDFGLRFRDVLRFGIAYTVAVGGLVLFNSVRYPDAGLGATIDLLLRYQRIVSGNAPFYEPESWSYFLVLMLDQHLGYAAAAVGLILLLNRRAFTVARMGLPVVTLVLMLVYFSSMSVKLPRYSIIFIPYAALVAGVGLRRCIRAFGARWVAPAVAAALAVYGAMSVDYRIAPLPDASEVSAAIKRRGYEGPLISSTPYILPHVENKVALSVIPFRFAEMFRTNREALVLYATRSFDVARGDTEAGIRIDRIEEELEATHERIFESGEPEYRFYLYRPRQGGDTP